MKLSDFSLKLDARSRFLLLVMILVLTTAGYYRLIYSPRAAGFRDTRERYLALKAEQERLESSMPELKTEQEKFQALKKKYADSSAQVQEAEKILPKNIHIPDILEFLVKDKKKYNLKIVTISSRRDKMQNIPLYKPPAASKQKPVSYYTLLPIEIEAFGSFDNVIAYIGNLERKLPYQRIGRLQINMQRTFGGQPQCFLTVLSILGRGQEVDEDFKDFRETMVTAEKIAAIEDPFRKKERPRLEERLAGFSLNGIIYKKDMPQAIINGEIYKVGDLLQKKKIIAIDENSVTLEEENKLFKLTIK